MDPMSLCRLTPLLLAVGLLLAGCVSEPPIAAAAPPVEGAVEHRIVAIDFAFEPTEITVTAGESTNLRLYNDGRTFHDVASDELDFRIDARAGHEGVGSITPQEPGTYELICTVPGHDTQGMTMRLHVEER